MPRFVKVKKSNRNRDRGFIAVDMICAAFENKDAGHTEIMTLDGFWYEVTDGIDELYKGVMGEKEDKSKEANPSEHSANPQALIVPSKPCPNVVKPFIHRKLISPANDDRAFPLDHECVREQKMKRGYVQKRYFKKPVSTSSKPTESLPSGDGRGQGVTTTKAVDFTPHEPMGT